MAQWIHVWSCLLVVTVGVAPPVMHPPPVLPAVLPTQAVVSQILRTNVGIVEALLAKAPSSAQLVGLRGGQPHIVQPQEGGKFSESALTERLGNTPPTGSDDLLRDTENAQAGQQRISPPSNGPRPLITGRASLPIVLILAAVAAGCWWSRRAQNAKYCEKATVRAASRSLLWPGLERAKFALAAFGSVELSAIDNRRQRFSAADVLKSGGSGSGAGRRAVSSNTSTARTDTKATLLAAVAAYNAATAADGAPSVDFGVKGGELDKDSRAPRDLAKAGAYYAVSERVGKAADAVIAAVEEIEGTGPCSEPTVFFGDKAKGSKCPLHGTWANLWTTAADATFSKDSKRGDAEVFNSVDATSGTTFNVINFISSTADAPPVEQLRVRLSAQAVSQTRIELIFRRVRVRLTRFLCFKRRVTLFIPVPGPFLTRILFFFRRAKIPKAYFDIIYLDDDLRVHRTGQGNLFIQQRRSVEPILPTD